ncbi:MAG: NirD/YgiW/YdeI family stress tolerance protein [Alphaproteobacteria bacterium]|nr:NirD/YgiW/YdeI family stress tolerance protein [Alphaproteobacteria bacterium]
MKNKFLSCLAMGAVMLGSTAALAGNMHKPADKPVSKVSEVNNMADDTMVYLQGYIVKNLGNEMYIFQDASGTMAIEIDDDLIADNTVSPDAMVWIAAEVDKNGNVVSLEADEIQFMPASSDSASKSMSDASNSNS